MKRFAVCLAAAVVFGVAASAQEGGDGIQLAPPGGELNPRDTITVSFPTAMIQAEKIDAGGMASPIAFEPPLDGRFLWKSVTEGEFAVPAELPPGVSYRARLAPGLRDAKGGVITAKIAETFTTPAFHAQSEVEETKHLRTRPQVLLEFNYAVDLSDVAERIYFQDRDSFQRVGSEISLRAIDRNNPEQSEASVLRVGPREDLPAGRTFDLILDGVRAQVGGKPLPFLQRFPLGTTQPLKVEWLGAFNAPRDTPEIRAKFSEELIPESVSPGDVTVEPAVPRMKARAVRDEIVVEGDFDVQQRYRVTIAKGVRGVSGYSLGAESRWGATFQPKPSAIFFPGPLIHERASSGLDFAFVQTNTGAAKWRVAALPIEKFAEVEKRLREFDEPRKDPVTGLGMIDPKTDVPLGKETEIFIDAFALPVVGSGDFPATAGADDEILRTIQWSPAAGTPPPSGLYLLEVTAPSKTGGTTVGHRSIICFSDAILTQKRGAETITLRAARMSDATPLAGAKVRLVNRQNFNLADGVTNAEGIVTFPISALGKFDEKESGRLFIAETVVGLAIQNLDAPKFSGAYESGSARPVGDQLRSIVFTDRNLYRPSHTVKIKGLARVADRIGAIRSIPSGAPVEWRISTEYQNDRLASGTTAVSTEGGWEAEWEVPSGIKLGGYRVTCRVAGADGGSSEFGVQEFKIPIFEVTATPDESHGPTNKSTLRVSSRFFSGQPNSGAKLHWKAVWNRGDYEAGEGFRLDDTSSENVTPDIESGAVEGDAVLDRDGGALLTSEAPRNLSGARYSVDWKVTVTSLDGQSIQPNRIVAPIVMLQPQLLGARVTEADAKPGQKRAVKVEVEAFDRDLQPTNLPGQAVVEVFHISTKVAKEKVAPFVFRYRNSPQFNPVGKFAIAVPGTLEVPLTQTGRYVAVVTAQGLKRVSASEIFGGSGDDEVPVRDDNSLDVVDPGKLTISPQFESKDDKSVGAKARLVVRSPFTGSAWVTVEADGAILDTFDAPIDGNNGSVELPIKPEYAPNAFATVYLVKPGGAKDLPAERFGVADFRVSRPDQELEIAPRFDAPTSKPGEMITGVVEVKSEGRTIEGADLTIFAVDDAILELGEWKAPEVGAAMRPPRRHGVATFLALNEFVSGISPKSQFQKGFTVGGGGEDEGRYVRKDFKALALWQTGAKTDAQGRAKFQFVAPDNLTRFRLVAVGQTRANQFGVGTQTVEVAKPLIAEPSLPRFLREGDEVDLRVVTRLGDATAKPGPVSVTVSVDSGLQLTSPATVTANVSKEKSAAFGFHASVGANQTSAKIRFTAKTDGDPGQVDEVEITLPIFPRVLPRKEAVAGALPANSPVLNPAVSLAPDWRKPGVRGHFDALISTSPYLAQLNALPAILAYPHGCFEQITTKVLAQTLLADLLKGLPPLAVSKQPSREAVEEALQSYAKNLLYSGQLPYWPLGDGESTATGNPFVTTSALWAVQQSAALGYAVPEGLNDKMTKAVVALLREAGSSSFQRAYAAYVLSQSAESPVTNADLLALHRERDKLSDEGRALLALAMHYRKTLPTEKLQLLREIGDFAPKERAFDPRTFSSADRAFAICLLAMNEIAPPFWTPEKRAAASQRLLKTLDELNLGSTQENLWSLLAFRTVLRTLPASAAVPKLKPPRTRAAFPQMSPDATAAFWPALDLASPAPVPIADLSPPNVSLRYLLTAEYTPPANLADNDRHGRGFRLERVVRNMTDPKRDGSPAAPYQLNDRLLITYRVVTPKQHYFVALEDELPAGLETINPDLKMLAGMYEVPEPRTWLDLSHVERRDRKTVLYFDQLPSGSTSYSVLARVSTGGTFRWPSSNVAPMYDLRTSGQSPASDVVVSGDR
jgi:alpha-2-macroglobulin